MNDTLTLTLATERMNKFRLKRSSSSSSWYLSTSKEAIIIQVYEAELSLTGRRRICRCRRLTLEIGTPEITASWMVEICHVIRLNQSVCCMRPQQFCFSVVVAKITFCRWKRRSTPSWPWILSHCQMTFSESILGSSCFNLRMFDSFWHTKA